jgi:hypothetical protein
VIGQAGSAPFPANPPKTLSNGDRVNTRFTDWIWHIKGSQPLPLGQSSDDAFGRLDPLFRESGTSYERTGDTLTFRKKDQAAQDKMSIFDGGVLRIEEGSEGPVLRYRLTSRALLFCFLAPLMFLSFAGLAVALGKYDPSWAEEAKKKDEKKDKVQPQNPIDKFLGAPAPEKPKDKDKKDKKAKKEEEKDKKPDPTPAYVLAGLFAALYVVGRILEDRLIKRAFRKKLEDE